MFKKKTPPEWKLHIKYIRFQCSHGLPLEKALLNLGFIQDREAAQAKYKAEILEEENATLRSKLSLLKRMYDEVTTV